MEMRDFLAPFCWLFSEYDEYDTEKRRRREWKTEERMKRKRLCRSKIALQRGESSLTMWICVGRREKNGKRENEAHFHVTHKNLILTNFEGWKIYLKIVGSFVGEGYRSSSFSAIAIALFYSDSLLEKERAWSVAFRYTCKNLLACRRPKSSISGFDLEKPPRVQGWWWWDQVENSKILPVSFFFLKFSGMLEHNSLVTRFNSHLEELTLTWRKPLSKLGRIKSTPSFILPALFVILLESLWLLFLLL